ncbi:hypothetical protein [Streptomyces sp. NPDC051452]|uniref:hypothetical protein n=1 Tax=Streptomyces sp. NPDC051452 TaxID=3365654 RepID=UPI0037B02D11
MRLTRRMAMAGVSATMAAGAVLAGGSSAMAATTTPPTAARLPVPSAAADTGRHLDHHRDARQPTDRWIEDQLATFYPSSIHRLAIFDPWVKDQLATFCPDGR